MQSAAQTTSILPGEVRRAQIAAYVRNIPVNAGVTASVSVFLAFIIAPNTPALPTAAWLSLQLLAAAAGAWRWTRLRHSEPQRPVSARGVHMAEIWSGYAGALWGAMALFLPYLEPSEQMAVVIVAASMAAGATSTLAPLPRAATYYVTAMLVPFVIAFALRGDRTNLSLAVLALVFNVAMVIAARRVYATFIDSLESRHTIGELKAQYERARNEWLEISDSNEAFALFDSDQNLQLWNSAFVRLWSLPEALVRVGVSRRTLLLAGAKPLHQTEQDAEQWLDEHLHLHESDTELTNQLDNDRWLVTRARRTAHQQLITVHVDITAIKVSEDHLRQKESELAQARRLEAIGRLAGGVAHDFNNLLTVVLGYAELIIGEAQQKTLQTPWALSAAQEIRGAAERGAVLARELLTFGQRHSTRLERSDLNRLVRNAEGMLKRVVTKRVAFELDLCETPCWVDVDIGQIEQVLLNLASNANDAMQPDGGVLTCATRIRRDPIHADREHAELSVTDTGSGIPNDVIEHIFEPFFTTKSFGRGTGLGLAIVHGIVEQVGGRTEVTSALGEGTSFRLLFPLQQPSDALPDHATAPSAETYMTRGERILVVEDEANVRTLLMDVLTSAGFTVTLADSAEAALQFDVGDFDFIISDVIMPGLSGPELLQRLRAQRPDLQALLISGYTDGNLEAQHMLLDDVALLRKPFSRGELMAAIQKHLSRTRDVAGGATQRSS